jgi:hypothetical protein
MRKIVLIQSWARLSCSLSLCCSFESIRQIVLLSLAFVILSPLPLGGQEITALTPEAGTRITVEETAAVRPITTEGTLLDFVVDDLTQVRVARANKHDPEAAGRRWRIAFHLGGTMGGPQEDLEDEMRRSGFDERSPGGFFGPGRDHPFTNHDVSGTASIRLAFQPRYSIGLILARSTTGETHGFQRGPLLGDFLFLRHSAISLAPVVSAELGAFHIGLGPAVHRWTMEEISGGSTTTEDTSWKPGFLVDAGLEGPARTRLFWDLRVQYRGAFGKWEIGSFQVGGTDEPVMFPSTELAYGHLFFGAGMGVRF